MIEAEKLSEIVERIVQNQRPDAVGVFGSYALGTATDTSDLDLLVIKRTTEPQQRRVAQVKRLLLGVMHPIDVAVYTPEELAEGRRHRFSFVYTVCDQLRLLFVSAGLDRAALGLDEPPRTPREIHLQAARQIASSEVANSCNSSQRRSVGTRVSEGPPSSEIEAGRPETAQGRPNRPVSPRTA